MTPHSPIAPGHHIGHAVLRTRSDDRLVDMARTGSEPAFEAIVARYRRVLLRYSASIVGEARAEDVVQDATVRAYVALGRGERVRRLKPWLYRIVHNTALNDLRDRSVADAALDERLPGGEVPEQAVERRQGLDDAVAAVRALPLRQRDAIVLRELGGRSYDEIADELGVSRGAARQLLSRARTSVRAGLGAFVPTGPLVRLVAPLADGPAGGRLAEIGAGGAAPKLCAVALAAGAIAGGTGDLPSLDRDAPATRAPSAQGGGSSGERAGATAQRSSARTPTRAATGSTAAHSGSSSTGRSRPAAPLDANPDGLGPVRPRHAERHHRLDGGDPSGPRDPRPARHDARAGRRPALAGPQLASRTAPPSVGPGPRPGGDERLSATRAPDGELRLHR